MKNRLYLTSTEIDLLLSSTLNGSYGLRNHCLILLAFRHGMRISEALGLRIQDIDVKARRLNVKRLKKGFSTVHPLEEDEILALINWMEERCSWKGSNVLDYVFLSQNGNVLSRQQAYRIVRHSGQKAGITIDIHPHMLRHSCGYELAERGTDTRLIQDYLGHRNIRHTVRYTASNAGRFIGLWQQESLAQRFKK